LRLDQLCPSAESQDRDSALIRAEAQ
jgi:hypothetical protein